MNAVRQDIEEASAAGALFCVLWGGSKSDAPGSLQEKGAAAGEAFTAAGPAPYVGDILDSPNLLWTEDIWDDEREREAAAAIASQGACVGRFQRERLELQAAKMWDLFYKRNGTNFYKDRHYLDTVFPELCETEQDRITGAAAAAAVAADAAAGGIEAEGDPDTSDKSEATEGAGSSHGSHGSHGVPRRGMRTLLELGCGVGNAVFPLLEANRGLFVVACDLSVHAIRLLRESPAFHKERWRCDAFVLDATADHAVMPAAIAAGGGVDMVLLQFSLSAVSPEKMAKVARFAAVALRPGGVAMLRDYGRFDEAQLRFGRGHRVDDNFYVRQDGTRAFYFSVADLRRLFVSDAGLAEVECEYLRRQYANRSERKARRRVFVHAKFQKPFE